MRTVLVLGLMVVAAAVAWWLRGTTLSAGQLALEEHTIEVTNFLVGQVVPRPAWRSAYSFKMASLGG